MKVQGNDPFDWHQTLWRFLFLGMGFLGVTGLLGGVVIILDPSGETLGFSRDLLAGSPFTSYLVPGLILLLVLGIVPLLVAGGFWSGKGWSRIAVPAVGLALVIYIVIQVLIIGFRPLPPLQLTFGLLGLGLLTGGALYMKRNPDPDAQRSD